MSVVVQTTLERSVPILPISCCRTRRNEAHVRSPCDTPKWTAVALSINIWHGVLALIIVGQYGEVVAFVAANFACVILALGGVFCKRPALLAPNVTIKILTILALPIAVMCLKIRVSKETLNGSEVAVLVWLVIVEISLVLEVSLTLDAFKKIDRADSRKNSIEQKPDLPPAYAVAIIDTELPTYDEAVKYLAQSQRTSAETEPTPAPSKETVLVIETL